jgi:hypothetical protein
VVKKSRLDTSVFNAVLTACIKTSHQQLAIPFLSQMVKFGIDLDEVTVGLFVSIATKTDNTVLAQQLLHISITFILVFFFF